MQNVRIAGFLAIVAAAVLVLGGSAARVLAQEAPLGQITVCKVLLSTDGSLIHENNVGDYMVPPATFGIYGVEANAIPLTLFHWPINFNASVTNPEGPKDGECITHENMPYGEYSYAGEVVDLDYDVDDNGSIALGDLEFIKSNLFCNVLGGGNCARSDLRNDGKVNLLDLNVVKRFLGYSIAFQSFHTNQGEADGTLTVDEQTPAALLIVVNQVQSN